MKLHTLLNKNDKCQRVQNLGCPIFHSKTVVENKFEKERPFFPSQKFKKF